MRASTVVELEVAPDTGFGCADAGVGMRIALHGAQSLPSWRATPHYGLTYRTAWQARLSLPAGRRSVGPRYRGMDVGTDGGNIDDGLANDTSMRISHEAIYQALYVQGRGA